MAETTKKRSGAGRWALRLGMILAGIAVGLGIAELVFRARDDGAFPHLNCYDADDALGVRLEPGCVTRIRVGANPVSDVRINSTGQRGGELPAPADDEILVLGDSQVFGLGVEENETFAAVLGELTERPVVNAGVPTYGPLEYVAVLRAMLETRHPRTVVVTFNMANDFFEHSRPDVERHGVWDHWAVRRETMPEDITSFPGREWLYQSSHAFFALRQALHQTDPTIDALHEVGFPSEGTLHDLVHEGEGAEERHAAAEAAHRAAVTEHLARIGTLGAAIETADDSVDTALTAADPQGIQIGDERYEEYVAPEQGLAVAHGHPTDIVHVSEIESSRDGPVGAHLLARAVHLRRLYVQRTLHHGDRSGAVQRALDARELADEAYLSERARTIDETPVPSILEPRLHELADLCAAHGSELIVVGLPLDVVVSDTEFAKYDAQPADVSGAQVLLTDLVRSAEAMGLRALDTTDALRAAEPGAFLDGDLHLTPTGHRAVATAIRDRMTAPRPLPRPTSDLPAGRTPTPTPDEMLHADEITVTGSSRAHCATQVVREWLRVSCTTHNVSDVDYQDHVEQPTGITLVSGGHGEAMIVRTEDAETLLVPVLPGDTVEADFHWADRTQRLTAHRDTGSTEITGSFGDRLPAAVPSAAVPEADARLCTCFRETPASQDGHGASCVELMGEARPECLSTYASDCAQLAACARGDLAARPSCPEGRVSALTTGRCLALCGDDVPCATGTCTPWQGARVCVP